MLKDVNISVTDGGLGSKESSGEGVHAKIGASPKTLTSYITITSAMNAKKIKELLGDCPLADAVMDSIKAGSKKIYCFPVTPSTDGTVSDVTATKSGTGTITISGKPNNAYDVQILITATGAVNVGTFIYTINGGHTWSDEITIPTDGEYAEEVTGLTFTFSSSATSFTEGDKFSFSTTAPAINSASIIAAVDKIKSNKVDVEFAHIVGQSNKALWVSMLAEAIELESIYKMPIFFVMEATNKTTEQSTVSAYVTALLEDRKGFVGKYIQVISGRALYNKLDGTTKDVNAAGIICGLYAKAKLQQSIGEVRAFPIEGITKLLPEGIEEHIAELDEAKFVTLRQYIGLDSFYVTNAWMMASADSDYQYAERMRVANKLQKETRKAALPALQSTIDMSNVDKSLAVIAEEIQIPVETMARNGEISSGRIIIPEDQDVLSTEKLNFKIRYVPVGYARSIDIDMGMEKPQ